MVLVVPEGPKLVGGGLFEVQPTALEKVAGDQGHQVVDLIMLHWLDVMFHTSLILLALTLSQ